MTYFSLLSRNFFRPTVQLGAGNSRSLFHQSTLAAYVNRFHRGLRTISSPVLQPTGANLKNGRAFSFFVKGATVAGVGLGLSTLNRPLIYCDASAPRTKDRNPSYTPDRPPPPASSVSLYELGFGTVAGLCAGVFVKKGAKAVAWFLGGIFVLLQYLGSVSLVRVDWKRTADKFENLFYTKDLSGATKPPNVLSLWNWLIDFLTADFQPRASFIAGFALGLRVG